MEQKMSSGTPVNPRRWKETLQTALAVFVLSVFLYLCNPGVLGRGTERLMTLLRPPAEDGELCLDDGELCPGADGEAPDLDYSDILSMPSCVDLAESIKALQDTRRELIESIRDGDEQRILLAKAKHREALHVVETGFTTFETRVPPDDFSGATAELLLLCGVDSQQDLMAMDLSHREKGQQ
jgi:hypothetical protein